MAQPVEQSGSNGSVDVTFEGDLGIITMRRGQNRFNEQFVEQMMDALDKVLENPNAKAVATVGDGRFYSNGLDLDWLMYIASEDVPRLDKFATKKGFTQLMEKLITYPLPTVALINGHAFAAGAIMAAFHDHVIMQTGKGWWCVNEVHIGRSFSNFLLEMLKIKLGHTYTAAVVLGQRFTGEEANAAGIAHQICAPSELLNTAQSWFKRVVPSEGYDREHMAHMKRNAFKVPLDQVESIEAKL